jgi:hypothetical protein
VGMNLFSIGSGDPAVGVVCVYRDDIKYDNYGTELWTPDYFPVHGTAEFRVLYDLGDKPAFERVVRHELGHALGFAHSTDTKHLMVGGISPQVENFSADEIAVIRCRYHIPRGLPLATYVQD